VTTTMVLVMYIYAPSTSDPTLKGTDMEIYAMPDGARLFSIIGSIIFVVPPVAMAIDISARTVRLIRAGVEAERARKSV
jgi:hypothetical protein